MPSSSATYRLQLDHRLDLTRARTLVPYLNELGVGACYASPILTARPSSNHGYDIVDHGRINPELGTEADFVAFAKELARFEMGLLVDVVPNHMCVAGSGNRWWNDVLENGPSSPYASFFDIDWQPPKADLRAKVLLPILGDQFGCVLEDRAIQIAYESDSFVARYWETRLPIAPRTWHHILEPALRSLTKELGESDPNVLELESILTALRHLPLRTDTEEARVRERLREKEIIKRRLRALFDESTSAKAAITGALDALNGTNGDPASLDRLEELLAEQGYRPSYWRVASDEINYRRFFDINELAAIRVEEPAVFRAVHEVLLRLARQGLISGLRVDHVDGLFAPAKYLADLRRAFGPLLARSDQKDAWVLVEKILAPGERLPDWPSAGTTGYDFTALVTGLLVEPSGLREIESIYAAFTSNRLPFEDVVYESKKLVLKTAMSSELTVLARKLDVISEQHRTTRDFTLNSLQEALGELIACFPVYRTYVGPEDTTVTDSDREQIERAIADAKRRNRATSASIFDFLRSLCLIEDPDGLDTAERNARRDFVLRLQQLTGPVMAKGLEDTAFYRHFPLAALAEVGAGGYGAVSLEAFHAENIERVKRMPRGLNATSTHDTKRGEDVRARLVALSEMPEAWRSFLADARTLNADFRTKIGGKPAPDANEEYLVYQTILGVWPPGAETASEELVKRVQEYLVKALREAKVHTSWINTDEAYERAVMEFAAKILSASHAGFTGRLRSFSDTLVHAGYWTSLSQVVLKIGCPGIPDFYQGTELWDLSLVDPDNRRLVDFDARAKLLSTLRRDAEADAQKLVRSLVASPADARIKMFVTHRALLARRAHRELFEQGAYVALEAEGKHAKNVVAFARRHAGREIVFVAGRFFTKLAPPPTPPVGAIWEGTSLVLDLPSARLRDVFTGRVLEAEREGRYGTVSLARVFDDLPVAVLEVVS